MPPVEPLRRIGLDTAAGVFDAFVADPGGGPDAPAREVLLLHGFPESALAWSAQLPVLGAAGCRAVAPDLRGYCPGVRPAEVSAYAVDELVADVLNIADALGWKRFDLVGHDWGAVLGWLVADRFAERVRTFTAVSVPHPEAFNAALRDDSDQQRRSGYLDFFRTPGAAEAALLADDAAQLKALLHAVPEPVRARHLALLAEPGALTAVLNWYRATRTEDVTAGVIGVPTLYVWGAQDIGVGRTAAEAVAAWVSGPYRFVELGEADHWIPATASGVLTELLLDQLRRHPD